MTVNIFIRVQVGCRANDFIRLWLQSYGTYYPDNWGKNSVYMAKTLSNIYPHLLDENPELMFKKRGRDHLKTLYQESWDVSGFYFIHLTFKLVYYIPSSLEELDGYNCTVGNAMRTVLYNSSQLRSTNITAGQKLENKSWIKETFR